MSKPIDIDRDNSNNDNNTSKPNTELIYNYTEALIKAQNESLNRLDAKLGGLLAFTGVLVKIAADLPGRTALQRVTGLICYTCVLLKVLTLVFLALAALKLCIGITAKLRGKVVSPQALMRDEWYFSDQETCQCYIINTWIETEQEYEQVGFEKSKNLTQAIWLISSSIVTLIISAVFTTMFEN